MLADNYVITIKVVRRNNDTKYREAIVVLKFCTAFEMEITLYLILMSNIHFIAIDLFNHETLDAF